GSTWIDTYYLSRNESSPGSFDKKYQYGRPNNVAFQAARTLLATDVCGPAINTGISVVLETGSNPAYPDGVCTNPGCSYKVSGSRGVCVKGGSPPPSPSGPGPS